MTLALPSTQRLRLVMIGLMLTQIGCLTHLQAGAMTTRDEAPLPGVTIRTHGMEDPTEIINSTPGSTLKVGPDAVDISLTYGLTVHQPVSTTQVFYLRGQLDVLNIGYDFGNPFPHLGIFGPGVEFGYLQRTQSSAREAWWSVSGFIDHDVRFGPGHKTYVGLSLGYVWLDRGAQ